MNTLCRRCQPASVGMLPVGITHGAEAGIPGSTCSQPTKVKVAIPRAIDTCNIRVVHAQARTGRLKVWVVYLST